MNKKVILEMNAFELIEWIDSHPLTMAYLYAIARNGMLGGEND